MLDRNSIYEEKGTKSTIPASGSGVRTGTHSPGPASQYPVGYRLPKASHVTLTLFNSLGQIISTLANECQEFAYHHVTFDCTGLAGGLYIYRIRAGSFVSSKRLVILR